MQIDIDKISELFKGAMYNVICEGKTNEELMQIFKSLKEASPETVWIVTDKKILIMPVLQPPINKNGESVKTPIGVG